MNVGGFRLKSGIRCICGKYGIVFPLLLPS